MQAGVFEQKVGGLDAYTQTAELRSSRLLSKGKITPYKEGTESYRRICSADLVAQSVQTKDWLRMKLSGKRPAAPPLLSLRG